MTITQFSKIKKQIERIIAQCEDEAINEGINISSLDFQELLLKLKDRLLAEWGLTLEEYHKIGDDMEAGLGKSMTERLDALLETPTKERRAELQVRTNEIVDNFNGEIRKLGSYLGGEIDKTKKSVLTRNDILDIVRPLIPKIPEHGDINHPAFIEQIDNLNKKINELIESSKTEDIKADLFNLQDEFTTLYDRVRKIKVPTDYVSTSVLEPSIKDIMGAELNRILRSFQSQVYLVDHAVKERVIRDGFYKITVSATEPTNPSVNDLWVDIS